MKHTLLLLALLALGLSPNRAAAQAPEQPAAAGSIHLRTEAPPPPTLRRYHMHDGFYARVNVGLGGLRARYDDDGGDFDLRGRGFALAADLLIGGSPTPGVAIGGAFLSTAAFSASFEQRDLEVGNRNLAMMIVGPFIDGFFDPKRGWHAGAALGLAGAQAEGSSGVGGISSWRGFGGAGWIGHDFWIADDWSLGVQYRIAAGMTADESNGVDLSIFSLSNTILFTALYH